MKRLLTIVFFAVSAQNPTFTHNRFTENGRTFSQDGAHIVELCITPQPPVLAPETMQTEFWQDRMLCGGYVEGVADLLSDRAVCIPPEVEGKQLVDVFLKYAAKHEDEMHGPASRIVANALQETYPCSKH